MPADSLVHIVDDDDAVRDSLEFLCASAELPARAYESAMAFLAVHPETLHGCIVSDVRMPDMTGLEMLAALKERGATLPVIIITGHGDVPMAVEAMRMGAFDFIEKPFEDEMLLSAIRRALDSQAPQPDRAERNAVNERIERLSARERQVLQGLVAGQLNKTIAYELGISARTVEVYRAKLMAKMKAGGLAELVRMTLQSGINLD